MGLFFGLNKLSVPSVPSIKYGRLYNWYAVSNALFAPSGWSVPTEANYNTLFTYIGTNTALKLSEVGTPYSIPFSGYTATNQYNFNIRQSGWRANSGAFLGFGDLYATGIYAILSTADTGSWEMKGFEAIYTNPDMQTTFRNFGSFFADGLAIRLVRLATVPEQSLADGDACDPCIDIDGNAYMTVKIGTQVWLADNWACTKLNDETPISNVTDDTEWSNLVTGAYCDYNNDIGNVFI
jgi:uncharacterized protein (TIGR02145 family)